MPALLKEFSILLALTFLGGLSSLVSGLMPLPWAEVELAPGEIRYEDAKTMDVIWLDARSESEYASGHLENAQHFDEESWDESMIGLMESWLMSPRPIVVYCSDEACGTSKRVADLLRDALPDAEIYSLKEGWQR